MTDPLHCRECDAPMPADTCPECGWKRVGPAPVHAEGLAQTRAALKKAKDPREPEELP